MDLTPFRGSRLLDDLVPRVHVLASVSLSASLPNACEAVHDYMGVTTYLHLPQSSLVQRLQVPYGPSWRKHL